MFESIDGLYDFGNLPPNNAGNIQVFSSPHNGANWETWYRPRGKTMAYIIVVGGGGGGGGGLTGATTTARGGGGGGACSGIARIMMPVAWTNSLKVQVGNGGKGGSGTGQSGSAGLNSYVSSGVGITAGTAAPNIIVSSNTNAPGGGTAGTNSGNAAGGSVPTIAVQNTNSTSAGIAGWAIVQFFTVGIVGSTGGIASGAQGTAVSNVWATLPLSAGSGGGGVTSSGTGFAGGAVNLQTGSMDLPDQLVSQILAGGVAGSASAAGNGNPGRQLYTPFMMTGGTGGGSSDGSTGGNGGQGGIGCGGGGGGGGTTGGAGGNGGDGIIIIMSW